MPTGFPDYYGGLTLPVTVQEGGTGATSVTAKALLYGAGTSHLVETNVGTANQVLQIDSVTLDPTFKDLVVSVSSITGILPVANGGTGTATPGLVGGSNIVISGTWPAQTVALNANPSISSLTATASATGEVDVLAIKNHSAAGIIYLHQNSTLDGVLNILDHSGNTNIALNGGTGAGSFKSLSAATCDLTPTTTATGLKLHGSTAISISPAVILYDDTGAASRGALALAEVATNFLSAAAAGDICLRADTGTLRLGTGTTQALYIDASQIVNIVGGGLAALAKYNGVSLVSPGIPSLVAKVDLTGQTTSISDTTFFTPSTGTYRISVTVITRSGTGSSTLTVYFGWGIGGSFVSSEVSLTSAPAAGATVNDGAVFVAYPDSGIAIKYATSWVSGGGSDDYDLHIRLEAI